MKTVNGLTMCDIVQWQDGDATRKGWLSPYGHPFQGFVYKIVPMDDGLMETLEDLISKGVAVTKIGTISEDAA